MAHFGDGRRAPLLSESALSFASESQRTKDSEEASEPLIARGQTMHPDRSNASQTRPRLVRANTRSATDMSVLTKLKDPQYVLEHYPKLDCGEVAAAVDALDGIVAVSEHTGGVASKGMKDLAMGQSTFMNAIMFKKRPCTSATLLHFAIWFVSEFGVDAQLIQLVLDSLMDPDEVFLPASYPGGPKTVFVSAVHIAAGLGLLDVLRILIKHVTFSVSESRQITNQAYVNSWARITPAHSNLTGEDFLKEDPQLTPFYQPIHEASFAGYGDVTLYLLQQKAECARNVQGITPLHFLAFIGITGTVDTRVGGEMRAIVKGLTDTGKRGEHLREVADMNSFIPGAKAVTPLELAVDDASRFPQDLLGLLAPCLSEGPDLTYFDDIKRIADVTADGALNLVRTIADKGKRHQTVIRRFRVNAQLPGMSDVLASIFYTAPLAAAEMLELLEIHPEVEDTAHHSIPARSGMWGFLQNVQMKCTYQNECINKDCLMIPYWEWKTRKEGSNDGWHGEFLPRPPRNARSTYIKNCRVVVCLLPNILDIDVFMAFAHIQKEHLATMSKKAVQGSIFCLWGQLIEHIWVLDIAFRFMEMSAYLALGVSVPSTEARSSVAWTIVAGSAMLQVASISFAVTASMQKWKTTEDPTMKSMWSPLSSWSVYHMIPNVIQVSCALLFALDLSFQHGERTKFDDRLLALCLMLACCRFIWSWRLSVIGSTIYTISETFFAGPVRQMLFITCMLLVSTIMALMILSKHHTLGLALSAYRGFLFGDDYAFNDLGMDVGHEKVFDSEDGVLLVSAVVGAFFFNVIVLNIIIAIYGHEYEKNQVDTPAQFMVGRADYCVQSVLAHYIFPWKGKLFNQAMMAGAVVLLAISIFIGYSSPANQSWKMWVSAVFYCVGAKMLFSAFIHCSWFSPEGQDAEENHRFLWICHTRDWGIKTGDDLQVQERIEGLKETMEESVGTLQTQLEDLTDKVYDIFDTLQVSRASPKSTKNK